MDILLLKSVAGGLSAFLGLIFAVPYIIDIFKGRTQPHLYSWLVWTIMQGIAVIIMFIHHAGWGAVGLGVGGASCAFILLLSLKYGTKNIQPIDTFCLVGALIATGIWLFLEAPLASILLITLIDFIGFIPTMRKSYEEPGSETLSTWIISATSNFFALLALQEYSWITVTYIASLCVTNSICAAIIMWQRR